VNKNIRSIVAAEEAVSFGVVEPLDSAFQTFHLRPLFLREPLTENGANPEVRKNV
jgi:hypothetical protein